jgi:hypothetical protein
VTNKLHPHITGILSALSWIGVGLGSLSLIGLFADVATTTDKADPTFFVVTAIGIMLGTALQWAVLQGAALALDYLADIRDAQFADESDDERPLLRAG